MGRGVFRKEDMGRKMLNKLLRGVIEWGRLGGRMMMQTPKDLGLWLAMGGTTTTALKDNDIVFL